MKKILSLVFLCWCIGQLPAQKNEIGMHVLLFKNQDIISGFGLSYFRHFSTKQPLGLSTFFVYENRGTEELEGNQQLSLLLRTYISSMNGLE